MSDKSMNLAEVQLRKMIAETVLATNLVALDDCADAHDALIGEVMRQR